MKKIFPLTFMFAFLIGNSIANIDTGFYVGGSMSYRSTSGQAQYYNNSIYLGSNIKQEDVLRDHKNFSLFAGYGAVFENLYVGSEISYTFENSEINKSKVGIFLKNNIDLKLKSYDYFGASLRIGYLVNKEAMIYGRLGTNFKKISLSDGNHTVNCTKPTVFVGAGIEIPFNKNVYMRAEYGIDMLSTIKTQKVTIDKIRKTYALAGLSYKF